MRCRKLQDFKIIASTVDRTGEPHDLSSLIFCLGLCPARLSELKASCSSSLDLKNRNDRDVHYPQNLMCRRALVLIWTQSIVPPCLIFIGNFSIANFEPAVV